MYSINKYLKYRALQNISPRYRALECKIQHEICCSIKSVLGEGRTKIVLEIMPTERNVKTACLLSNHSSLLLSKCKQYTLADQIWIFRFLNLSVRQSIRVQTISVPRSSKLNINFKNALRHGFFNESSLQIYFLHTAFTDLNSKQDAHWKFRSGTDLAWTRFNYLTTLLKRVNFCIFWQNRDFLRIAFFRPFSILITPHRCISFSKSTKF